MSEERTDVCVRDVDAGLFVLTYAAHLKKAGKVEVPKWVDLVKTGPHKELAPYNEDWWYVRIAACARNIYTKPGVGVGALTRHFGGNENRGVKPSHFHRSSPGIVRKAIQQLQKQGLVEVTPNGGRRPTKEGMRECDLIARQAYISTLRK